MVVSLEFIRFIGGGMGDGAEQMNSPRGLALRQVEGRETVLVADTDNDRVSEFELDGTFVKAFECVEHKVHQQATLQLQQPNSATVLPMSGEVAVTDTGNNRVVMFDGASGKFVRSFGKQGTEDGQFERPIAIVADAHDNCVVLDVKTGRAQCFTVEGKHICTRSDLLAPDGYNFKGIAWMSSTSDDASGSESEDDGSSDGGGSGSLAIAMGAGHGALVFDLQL
jgi:DNA-binding beta-propeller fold protein YncE